MPSKRTCCVFKCTPRNLENISYHSFPANINVNLEWKEALFNYADMSHVTDYTLVCSEHFKSDNFRLDTKRRKLIPGAIPSIFEVGNDLSDHVTSPKLDEFQNLCNVRDIDVQTDASSFQVQSLLEIKRSLTQKLNRLVNRLNIVKEKLEMEKLKNKKASKVDYIRHITADAAKMDPRAIFLLDQIRNYHKKKARWTKMTLHHCHAWRGCFPNGYEFPRDCFLKLPSKTTLHRYVQEDSSKFGQKMLERMGWKEGKGLGRNEDGLTDYVKVAYKNNSKGELSTNDDTKDQEKKIKSLEEKSQNSRARVHYKKFTRGKDLSRYSQKDLANIFGRKKLEKDAEDVVVDEQEADKGVFTTSGSMVDYFKNKMSSNANKTKSNENSGDEQAAYGFGFEETNTKKNKKSKQKDTFVSYVDGSDDNVAAKKRKGELDEAENTPSKKKLKFEASPKTSKKSKRKLKTDDHQGLINPAFEPLGSNVPIKKHALDTIIEDDVDGKQNECEAENNCGEKMDESTINDVKCKNKKKKKKTESLALDNTSFNDGEVPEDLEQETKRKKNKKCNKGLDNPALNISVDGNEVKRKKAKSKGLDNPALSINDSPPNQSIQNFEVKRKKKKLNQSDSQDCKSLQTGIENAALEISDGDIMLNVTNEPVKSTPTPKKVSKNKFTNPRFNKTKIATRSPGDIDKRNELYEINTKVIQDGLRNIKKQTNQNFDIKSVDNIDFCDDGVKSGIDNRGFDVRAQNVEESVNSLTKTIDNYQAEVENGINESKMKKTVQREGFMVGAYATQVDGENESHEEGVLLRFKHAKFSNKMPAWAKREDVSASFAKKSYKHLIRGDIIVGFKNANLHQIEGYATTK